MNPFAFSQVLVRGHIYSRNAEDLQLGPGDKLSIVKPLPKVETRKQFMDQLTSMIAPPKSEVTEAEDLRGHPTLLKSYLIESNAPLQDSYRFDHTTVTLGNTGIEDLKILTMKQATEPGERILEAQFYVDVSSKRFLVFHTNYRAAETHDFMSALIASQNNFDSAWLSTDLLKKFSTRPGNINYGFHVDYEDIFHRLAKDEEDDITPKEDFKIDATGSISNKALSLLRKDKEVERTMGYERITVGRGTKRRGVLEDLRFNGRASVIKGKSIDEHMVLLDTLKKEYANQVGIVEKQSIYANAQTKTLEGTAFEFEFDRDVENWNLYIDRVFNAREPFNIWGMKAKAGEGLYRILAVDMHTGHPFDVEVSDHLLRVYLPKGSCGNAVLRLFVNLQRYFDSMIKCPLLAG
jgi:hypothetical protein